MRETRVARRYALALYKTALASGNLDIIATDIHQLNSFSTKDRNFLNFLEAPQVSPEQKKALLKSLFTTRLSPRLLLFVDLLLDKHRTGLLPDIADEFGKLIEEHRGQIKAKVITAVHMPDDARDQLRVKLENLTGKKIEIIHRIDKSIIGGIVIHLHNMIIDKSIKHQLAELRNNLLKVKVH